MTADCAPCEALAAEEEAAEIKGKTAPWSGPIGIEGQRTGDGRHINVNALRWENLPIPLRHVTQDHGGHDGAVVVGRIDDIQRLSYDEANERLQSTGRDPLPESFAETGIIWGIGVHDLGSEIGREAHRQVKEGMQPGISMDLDDVVIEEGDGEDFSILEGRIRAATQVAIPAFDGARIAVDSEAVAQFDQMDEQFNWVDDVGGLPEYIKRIKKHLTKKGMTESHAIATAVNVVKKMCATGDLNFPGAQQVNVGSRAEACAAVADWERKKAQAKATAAETLVAGAAAVFKADWFENPNLSGPTAIVVTDEGRIFGHIAAWDTCHIAHPQGRNVCTQPPRSHSNYAYFHTGSVLTDKGEKAVGRITMNTLHAGPRLNNIDAQHHYEHTGATGAYVVAGEDAYGIWIAGAVHPDADVTTLKAAPLSGDWRKIQGNLELVSALSVNIPGFPIPRPQALVASGSLQSLVASGIIDPEPTRQGVAMTEDDVRMLRDQMRDLDRKDRAAALAARVNRSALLARIKKTAGYVQQFDYNPDQWRMPKGNEGAGQWIDMPDVAVADLVSDLMAEADKGGFNDKEAELLGNSLNDAESAAEEATTALKAADGEGAQAAASRADEYLSDIEAQLFQHADNGTIDEDTAARIGEKLDNARSAVASVRDSDLTFLGEDSDIGAGEDAPDDSVVGDVPEGPDPADTANMEVPLGWSDQWPAGFLEAGDEVTVEEDANGDLVDLKVVRDGEEIDTEGLEAAELDAFMESQKGGTDAPAADTPTTDVSPDEPGGSIQQQAGNDAETVMSDLQSAVNDAADDLPAELGTQVNDIMDELSRAISKLNAGIQDGNYNAADLAKVQELLSRTEAVLMNAADGPGLSDEQANSIGIALDDVFAAINNLDDVLQGEMTPPPFAGRSYARQWLGRRGVVFSKR